ncbi:hypothetical protein TOPH_08217 [Tolypocladium ophioglossoides CBS 100239]|uniref:Uncharacterized protein n=1 Tax=Tolypocladium ophioglossoides (strain CBS 100239) TaxID=1163406 RepID=A0A0L0MZB3_TOLOC|nr:hypothetical protein TOPH_08217 [Tolypocladium ophioglossoides CBS 100239]
MSGITDEAAMEGHDLIQRAEEEEERASTWPSALHEHDHDHDTAPKDGAQATGTLGDAPAGKTESARKESRLDKVKEALHLRK